MLAPVSHRFLFYRPSCTEPKASCQDNWECWFLSQCNPLSAVSEPVNIFFIQFNKQNHNSVCYKKSRISLAVQRASWALIAFIFDAWNFPNQSINIQSNQYNGTCYVSLSELTTLPNQKSEAGLRRHLSVSHPNFKGSELWVTQIRVE